MGEIDLFGEEIKNKKSRKEVYEDYDGFVKKFEHKKTTDDCYTPIEIYDCVLEYVRRTCDIGDARIVRPFYTGGDFEKEDYSGDCVVVDNPPFSILARICRYYEYNGIRYFLFAPNLTLLSTIKECTKIVVYADITYENGAKVKTSFVSNMYGDAQIIIDGELKKDIENVNKRLLEGRKLPKYEYPDEVLTIGGAMRLANGGIKMTIRKNDVYYISKLDCQKEKGKSIFGGGYLLSDRVAADRVAADRVAADRVAADRVAADRVAAEIVEKFRLSEREKGIIKKISGGGEKLIKEELWQKYY